MLPEGTRQITGFLLPGDVCDMGGAVLRRMDHSVMALTPVTVTSIKRAKLVNATLERPSLAQAFWWASLADEAVLRAWIVNLGRRNAYSRLAHQMCELHARMKRVGLVADGDFTLPLTQTELADALGLTPVHINRMLKRLRSEGLIRLHNHMFTILDAERLGAAAGFDPGYLHGRPV